MFNDFENFEKELQDISPLFLKEFVRKYLDLKRMKELSQYPLKVSEK